MLSRLSKFLHYWYFRYLMATELLMVETWERHLAHGILLIFAAIMFYINTKLLAAFSTNIGHWMQYDSPDKIAT